jgi:hypothetical protein
MRDLIEQHRELPDNATGLQIGVRDCDVRVSVAEASSVNGDS